MITLKRKRQYILFCAGSFSVLQAGLNDGWSSYALPELQSNTSTTSLTNEDGSWIASAFPIGSIIGSLLLAATLDRFGRKTMLLIGSFPFFVTWMVIVFTRTIWSLSTARVLAGISDGIIYAMVPVYIAETSDPKIRGFLITGIKIIYVVGIFLANLLGAFLNITNAAIVSSALSLGVLLCLSVPESPYFYMIKKDDNKAKHSIKKFNNCLEIESIRTALNEQETNGGKWIELFTEASNRKSLSLVIAMKLFEQFTGSMCFTFYSQTIFYETKSDVSSIVLISIYYGLQVVVLMINGMVIDRIGRRPLIVASASSVVVALLVITVYLTLKNVTNIEVIDYSWCPVFGLFLFIIGFTLGLQNIPDLLVSEIFALHVKSVAVSIFYVVDGLSTVAVSKLFQYTNDEFGMHVPFIIFSVCSLCGIPLFLFCVPETKRKTLEDIERSVRSKHGK